MSAHKSKILLFIHTVLCFSTMCFCARTAIADALVKPKNLVIGDTVSLISSASRAPTELDIQFAKERLEKIGLKVVLGKHVYARDGYFAGTDLQRAADLNDAFSNPQTKAIFEIRGGWGSNRILSLINYENIKKHPKIFIGFSDITSLLLAINKKTGLETFHGPMGSHPWPQFTVEYLQKVLFEGSAVTFENPHSIPDPKIDNIQTSNRITTLHSGIASGPLIGGNLSVLVTLLGTEYEPDWNGKILFVEDVGEDNYKIDRLLSQLELAGVFKKIHGFIFGECTECVVSSGYGAKTLYQIIDFYTKPYNIPVFMGAAIGHEPLNFTLPEGLPVEINADSGSIKMLQPAVT